MKPEQIKPWLLTSLIILSLGYCSFRLKAQQAAPGKIRSSIPGGGSLTNKLLKTNATNCDIIHWAKWSQFLGSSATGTIDDGAAGPVSVSMSSNFDFSSTPMIYNYWLFSYYPAAIPNETVPKTTWSAGNGGTTDMFFSRQVTNPVLLISSLGQMGQSVKLGFSLPYVVLYDGGGMTYNTSTTITGEEGYAIIMFPGDFKGVTITSTTPEDYTNITWGLNKPPFTVNITEMASSCGSTTVTASGGLSYTWNGGDTPNSAVNTFHTSSRYIVTVKNADGCTASVSKQIDIHTGPAITVNGNLTDCGSVTATAFADNAVSYLWDGGDTPNKAANTFHTRGRYKVTVTDTYGCQASVFRDIIVNETVLPTVNITASPAGPVCSGVPITYTASTSNGGASPTLSWLKNGVAVASGKTFITSDLVNGDKIECLLTSDALCAVPAGLTSNTIIADIKEAPTITFPEKMVIDGPSPSIQLNPTISGEIISYLWTPATGLSASNIRNPIATPEFTTSYSLTVISATGCEATANAKVLVLKNLIIPNTFTPNGDGVNDTWNIINLADFQNATVDVYNRYGISIYHSTGYAKPWDGTYNGKSLPAGTYYYVIDPKDKMHSIKSGWVALFR
jgi:gliding motility-associated-like protein